VASSFQTKMSKLKNNKKSSLVCNLPTTNTSANYFELKKTNINRNLKTLIFIKLSIVKLIIIKGDTPLINKLNE